MDAELRAWLVDLTADVQRRKARFGDPSYDTLVVAHAHLSGDRPNLPYLRRVIGLALGKY